MSDHAKLLDGTVEEVKNGLASLHPTVLAALLAAEQAGKNRKGVVDAITEAQTAASVTGTVQGEPSSQANIAPATEIEASGAPHQVTPVDLDHPAVDNNPRANTTSVQNQIDFNDPSGLSWPEMAAKARAEADAAAEQAK